MKDYHKHISWTVVMLLRTHVAHLGKERSAKSWSLTLAVLRTVAGLQAPFRLCPGLATAIGHKEESGDLKVSWRKRSQYLDIALFQRKAVFSWPTLLHKRCSVCAMQYYRILHEAVIAVSLPNYVKLNIM